MLIAKNDEEKRSKLWRFVTISATIVIVCVVAFFITKLFAGNPLKGSWRAEDNNLTMTIEGDALILQWDELLEEKNVTMKMDYTLDKSVKTITIKASEQSVKETVEKADGKFSEQQLKAALREIALTLDYSVERNKLILTEREYGEQMVFTKE